MDEMPDLVTPSTRPKGTRVEVKTKTGGLLFYHPESNSLIGVPPGKGAVAVANECERMHQIMEDFLLAKEAYGRADRAYMALVESHVPNPIEIEQKKRERDEAAKKVEETQKVINDELKPLKKLDGNIMELIPIHPVNGRPFLGGKKMTYVRSDKVKNHWRTYKLNENVDSPSTEKNALKDGKVDWHKMGKQLTDLETKAKLFEKEWPWLQGSFADQTNLAIKSQLGAWAESWNKSHAIQLEASAQVMRYFAGASLGTTWDPKGGKLSIKGGAQAEFVLAEAKGGGTIYLPRIEGWTWTLDGPRTGITHRLATVRFKAALELYGMAGASASLGISLGVDYTNLTKGEVGLKGQRHDALKKPATLNIGEKIKDADTGLNADLDLFAGVKAGCSFKGGIEWWNPNKEQAKPNEKWITLADVGPTVEGRAGAGLQVHLEITYQKGKFRFKAMAAACLGVGAKGALELEVDVKHLSQFLLFLAHNLYQAGYEYVVVLQEEAFHAWKTLCFAAIHEMIEFEAALHRYRKELEIKAEELYKLILNSFDKEIQRTKLMEGVLAAPHKLLFAPPETKGMILYQLTRHDKVTDLNPSNYDAANLLPWNTELLPRRKEAVMVVLKQTQTKSHFDNVLQHMTSKGTKGDLAANKQHLEAFLRFGGDPRRRVDDVWDRYQTLQASLQKAPILYAPLVPNDSPMYQARAEHPPMGPFRREADFGYV